MSIASECEDTTYSDFREKLKHMSVVTASILCMNAKHEQAIADARLVGYEAKDGWDAEQAIADGYLMHLRQIWGRNAASGHRR